MEVNTRALAQASEQLRHCARSVDRAAADVERVRRQLRELSNVDEFRWILKRNELKLEQIDTAFASMASVLETVSMEYKRTEDRICERDPMSGIRFHGIFVPEWSYHYRPVMPLRRLPVIYTTRKILRFINRLR